MIGLNELDQFNKGKKSKPENHEFAWWIFWKNGISYGEFCETPIPVIMSIIHTQNFMKEKEAEAYKKKK